MSPCKSHYNDVILGAIASQITSLAIVYSVKSGADQRKHQSSASLAFVQGIHRWPVNSPHKWPVTRNMFPFDVVIMRNAFTGHWVAIEFQYIPWIIVGLGSANKSWRYNVTLSLVSWEWSLHPIRYPHFLAALFLALVKHSSTCTHVISVSTNAHIW